MPKGHSIIYIPGLGDDNPKGQRLALKIWRLWHVKTKLIHMNWADKRRFETKLRDITDVIDAEYERGYTVSIVGVSAGASAALNAYAARLDKIHSVTLICGQVLGGQASVHPKVYSKNGAFFESMQHLGASLEQLDDAARKRVISIHPLADEAVPIADTKLPGAQWRQIPTAGHFMSIAYAITIGSRRIVRDIKHLKKRR